MRWIVPALGLVLAGCAARQPIEEQRNGQVSVGLMLAPAAPRLTLERNEAFQPPLAMGGNALPQYPLEALSERLPPQVVCLGIGVDEEGSVFRAEPMSAVTDCPADADRRFISAAQAAVRSWRFDPAFRCVFPPDRKPNANACYEPGVEVQPQAISLTYRFVFEQIDGRGTVRQTRE